MILSGKEILKNIGKDILMKTGLIPIAIIYHYLMNY